MSLPMAHKPRIGANRTALYERLAAGSRSPRRALEALLRLGSLDRPRRVRVIPVRAVPGSRISAADILAEVAGRHRVTVGDLASASKGLRLAAIRHEAMYEIARRTPLSLPQIGRAIGDRDHTTVRAGIRKHAQRNGLTPPRAITSKET